MSTRAFTTLAAAALFAIVPQRALPAGSGSVDWTDKYDFLRYGAIDWSENAESIIAIDASNLGIDAVPNRLFAAGNLEVLDLSGNELANSAAVAEALSKFAHLEILHLGRNPLKTLGPEWRFLADSPNIKVLSFSSARLERIDDAVFAGSSLEILSLFGNSLSELPEGICGAAELQKLLVGKNRLISLPMRLSKLPRLKRLQADHNKLTATGIHSLPVALETIILDANNLTEFPQAIRSLSNLSDLSVGENAITELPEWLSQLPIQYLNLRENQIRVLPPWLVEMSELEGIDVTGNPLEDLSILKALQERGVDVFRDDPDFLPQRRPEPGMNGPKNGPARK